MRLRKLVLDVVVNYFEVFDLPRLLNIDPKALEKKFHALSRKHHPDYFSTAPIEQRELAVRMTALLNDAYRTLRHPVRRVEYLLNLEGYKPDGSKAPKSFLMDVFELNEQIEEAKAGRASEEQKTALRNEIERRAAQFDAEIRKASDEWDRLARDGREETQMKNQLMRMNEILSEASYIHNLKEELEAIG